MIKETSDYTIFSKHKLNRELDEANINKLVASLKIKNLMHKRPILVDAELEIIDGQHRLAACERLGISVFYEVEKELESSDIILLNANQRSWRNKDYIRYHANAGNKEYVSLVKFAEKYGLDVAIASRLFYKGGKGMNALKDGTFKMPLPTDEKMKTILDALETYRDAIDYLRSKLLGNKQFINGKKFNCILIEFLSGSLVDKEIFMQKLVMRIDVVAPRASASEYWRMWKEIYNFRNNDPLP